MTWPRAPSQTRVSSPSSFPSVPSGHTLSIHQHCFLGPDSLGGKEEEEEEKERRWHGGQTPRGTQPGRAGDAGAGGGPGGALKHECLWGQAGGRAVP